MEEEGLLGASRAAPAAGASHRRAVPEELVPSAAVARRGEGDRRGGLGALERGDGEDDRAREVDRGAEGHDEDVGRSGEGARLGYGCEFEARDCEDLSRGQSIKRLISQRALRILETRINWLKVKRMYTPVLHPLWSNYFYANGNYQRISTVDNA